MIRKTLSLLIPVLTILMMCEKVVAAEIEGNWSGSGYVAPTKGKRENVRCKIRYKRHTAKVFAVRAVCASPSAKVIQTGEVLKVKENLYVGDFYSPDYDISGRVRVTVSGSRQKVTFSSARGRGAVTLSKRN